MGIKERQSAGREEPDTAEGPGAERTIPEGVLRIWYKKPRRGGGITKENFHFFNLLILEREGSISLFSHPFMHSLGDSCMRPD